MTLLLIPAFWLLRFVCFTIDVLASGLFETCRNNCMGYFPPLVVFDQATGMRLKKRPTHIVVLSTSKITHEVEDMITEAKGNTGEQLTFVHGTLMDAAKRKFAVVSIAPHKYHEASAEEKAAHDTAKAELAEATKDARKALSAYMKEAKKREKQREKENKRPRN